MVTRLKYPRTWHLPWSLGASSDDKTLASVDHFVGQRIVVTEKVDGENSTIYHDGYTHARSIDSRGGEDRDWLKRFAYGISHDIPPGWRICGENMWARHSIGYDDLPSYFLGFSMWDENDVCLPWDETLAYFEMLGVSPVPELYRGIWDEDLLKTLANSLDTQKVEGYVVRVEGCFTRETFSKSVAKFVRANHVQTDKHWRTTYIRHNAIRME